MSGLETKIRNDIFIKLNSIPGCVVWRNNVGVATAASGNTIRYGVGGDGGSDLIGIYKGKFLAVEVKTPTGRLTENQKRYIELVNKKGGIAFVATSEEEALQCLMS
jgi:hypothetical protein